METPKPVMSPAQLLPTVKRLIDLLNLYDQPDLVSIQTAASLHMPFIHTAHTTQFIAHVHTYTHTHTHTTRQGSRITYDNISSKIATILVRCVGQITNVLP
jgi:hypothetical protein